MEERFQMKVFPIAALACRTAALAGLLWLAGCAAPLTADKSAAAPKPATPASAPAVPPAPMTSTAPAYIPFGPLQPIAPSEAASRGVAQLQPPADLWERIRRGFAMPNLDNDLVRQQEQ